MKFILQALDELVPERLRSNPSDLMRAYVLIGVLLSNLLVSLLVLVIIHSVMELPAREYKLAVGLDLACMLTYIGALLILRVTSNYQLTSNITILCLALVIFAGIQITGGFEHSPVLKMSVQITVSAFLLLGLRGGIFWLGVTMCLCFISYLCYQLNTGSVQYLSNPADIQTLSSALTFVLLLLVGGALVVYELINGNLNRRLNEERNRFEHKASHDPLTGLPNRFEFFRRLNSGLSASSDRQQKLALAYIDLDGFKPVNDQYGHHAGGEILKIISHRLQDILRLSDTTARLGGDEFALILPGIRVPDDLDVVIPKILNAISQPIDIGEAVVNVRGSVGVSLFPDHTSDVDTLCRYADKAMYQAKENNNTWVCFQPPLA